MRTGEVSFTGSGAEPSALSPAPVAVADTVNAPLMRIRWKRTVSPAGQPPGKSTMDALSPCPWVETSRSLIAFVEPLCSNVQPSPICGMNCRRYGRVRVGNSQRPKKTVSALTFGSRIFRMAPENFESSHVEELTTRLLGGHAIAIEFVG